VRLIREATILRDRGEWPIRCQYRADRSMSALLKAKARGRQSEDLREATTYGARRKTMLGGPAAKTK